MPPSTGTITSGGPAALLSGALMLAVFTCSDERAGAGPRSPNGKRLTFTKDATGLTVTAPGSGNIAPPGYYMVFIVNGTDVPSVAKIVKVY